MKPTDYIEWDNLKDIPFFLCQVVEDREKQDLDIYYLGKRVLHDYDHVGHYLRTAVILFRRVKSRTADWVNLRNLWTLRNCVRENYNHGIGMNDLILGRISMEIISIRLHHLQRNALIFCVSGLRNLTHMQLFNTPLSEGRACLCVLPLGGREGDKKKYHRRCRISVNSLRCFFATLPYRSARVVFVYGKDSFFPEVSLSVVDLVVYLCQNCAAGGMGASPHTR